MANTYSWDIPAVDCRPLEEGNTDVVYNVHWRYSASDDVAEPDTKQATIIGTQVVAAPEGDFIPFADFDPRPGNFEISLINSSICGILLYIN